MPLSDRKRHCDRRPEGGARHSERREDCGGYLIRKRLAAEAFTQKTGKPITRIRVRVHFAGFGEKAIILPGADFLSERLVVVTAEHGRFVENSRSMRQKLMSGNLRQLWRQSLYILSDGFVEIDFALIRQVNQRRRREHLRRGAESEEHLGAHGFL